EIQIDQVEKLQSPLKLAEANWGLIRLLIDNKKLPESQKVWQKYLETPADDEETALFRQEIEERMILLMAQDGFGDEAIKLLDKKLKKNPKDWLTFVLKCDVFRQLGKLEDAARSYEEVIDGVGKDENVDPKRGEALIRICRYTLSSIFIDLDK